MFSTLFYQHVSSFNYTSIRCYQVFIYKNLDFSSESILNFGDACAGAGPYISGRQPE